MQTEKATAKKIRSQIHQLIDIVLDTNGLEKRNKELTGVLPTLFVRYMGHVNCLDICINRKGWEPDCTDTDELLDWTLDHPLTDEKMREIKNICYTSLTTASVEEMLKKQIESTEELVNAYSLKLAKMRRKLAKMKRKEALE